MSTFSRRGFFGLAVAAALTPSARSAVAAPLRVESAGYVSLLQNGIMSVNEVRAIEDRLTVNIVNPVFRSDADAEAIFKLIRAQL